MTKRALSIALAAAIAFTTMIPLASDAEARRYRRGGAIAAGVLVGAAALAIAAGAANASERRDGESQCRRWARHCDRGSDWACRKFDNHC